MAFVAPKTVDVSLKYDYLEKIIVFTFPRLRKKDADLQEQERLLGDGKKMKPANKLAAMVLNVTGLEDLGFAPKSEEESPEEFSNRVLEYFSSEDGQEIADDALLYRVASVYPQNLFRGR